MCVCDTDGNALEVGGGGGGLVRTADKVFMVLLSPELKGGGVTESCLISLRLLISGTLSARFVSQRTTTIWRNVDPIPPEPIVCTHVHARTHAHARTHTHARTHLDLYTRLHVYIWVCCYLMGATMMVGCTL